MLCWGFSAEGVRFGADEVHGFNDFAEAVTTLETELMRLGDRAIVGIEESCPRYISRDGRDALARAGWQRRPGDGGASTG